jgi:CBS domain-containing protein
MLVKDCMTKNVVLGNPNITLREAAQKMRDGDFGILPIAEDDRLVGMLSDRDIAVRAVAEGKDPKQNLVRDFMSKDVFYCFEDQTDIDVMSNLGQKQIRRLPVLNRDKKLVGILSLGDLALKNAPAIEMEEALSHICKQNKTK